MQLHKTDKARSALLERTDTLTAQDRRILILSDGQRSLDDIAGLLGSTAGPAVLRLVEERYLATSHAATASIAGVVAPTAGSATTSAIEPSAASIPPAPPATRRSLAATRMYMLDMLQLQRDAEAAGIKATIQTSIGPEALVAAVLQGLQHIQRIANPSYSQRVFDRVAEMIPEEALPALQAQCAPASTSSAG
jgi:hypothetical protein